MNVPSTHLLIFYFLFLIPYFSTGKYLSNCILLFNSKTSAHDNNGIFFSHKNTKHISDTFSAAAYCCRHEPSHSCPYHFQGAGSGLGATRSRPGGGIIRHRRDPARAWIIIFIQLPQTNGMDHSALFSGDLSG